jgi:hypothetical protein
MKSRIGWLGALVALAAVLTAGAARSQVGEGVIWQQTDGGEGHWGPSQLSRDPVYPAVRSSFGGVGTRVVASNRPRRRSN